MAERESTFFDGVEEEHGCLAAWEAKAGVATSETGSYEAVRPSSRQVLCLGGLWSDGAHSHLSNQNGGVCAHAVRTLQLHAANEVPRIRSARACTCGIFALYNISQSLFLSFTYQYHLWTQPNTVKGWPNTNWFFFIKLNIKMCQQNWWPRQPIRTDISWQPSETLHAWFWLIDAVDLTWHLL
jgi:hypothetical protein